MKNEYSGPDESGCVTIWLRKKAGSLLGCKIDAEDLALIESFPGTWCLAWRDDPQTHYAVIYKMIAGKSTCTLMHRVIANAPVELVVDHIDHDGLNNRRVNLRNTDRVSNSLNRRGPSASNTTGFLGVFRKRAGFCAQIKIGPKRICLHGFKSAESASIARSEAMREATKKYEDSRPKPQLRKVKG